MALEYAVVKDGRRLDLVTFDGPVPTFDTGAARDALGRLAATSGLSGQELEQFAAGWSNGYVTLRPAAH